MQKFLLDVPTRFSDILSRLPSRRLYLIHSIYEFNSLLSIASGYPLKVG
jgi:hypothetical protein